MEPPPYSRLPLEKREVAHISFRKEKNEEERLHAKF